MRNVAEHKKGYVYLIHCVGFPYYKIGIAKKSPSERAKVLQKAIPFELKVLLSIEVPDCYVAESILHENFRKSRIRQEWFIFDAYKLDEVKDTFKKLKKAFDK